MKAALLAALIVAAPAGLLAQVDRTAPPAIPPLPPLHVPVPQTARLANGLELVVVPMHKVPVVDINLLVRAGSVRDDRNAPGLATFTATMLDQGAGRRAAPEIAEQAAFLGAQLRAGASNEWAVVSLHVPKRQLDSALDLMADVVLRPTFPDSEVNRQRELRRSAILQLRDQPTAQAPIAFNAIVYGANHPYGAPIGGTEASTAALSREAVQSFYQTYYRPNVSRIIVVGDVSLAEARALITARFGGWARAAVPALDTPQPPAPSARTFYLVDKPGAAQSVIRIGHVGVQRNSPDYYALRVMNTILGGSFTSRLNQNLRETHGYTYGANSGFTMRRLAGPFVASASVVTAKTDSSLIEFLKELRRIRDSVVPGEELAKAKAYMTLGFPGDFETTFGTAQQFLDLLQNDMPLTTLQGLIAGINRVSAADVQRVARRYLDPDHFAIVVVGDRSQIETGIRALNEGPISMRDLWGQEIH
ncbi:MAG: M16 family metallopeptidase [Gemmatimonadales bacterium]